MPGLLRIEGTIGIDQFWPEGSSDADTTKILVRVDRDGFAFAADGRRFRPTQVFFGAEARGTGRKAVIDSAGRITVRLQGIDAPELHFKAAALPRSRPEVTPERRAAYNALNRTERRQYLGETATVALAAWLRRHGTSDVRCRFVSAVETPGDVIDTYGRFVGNIAVGRRFATDVNLWLAAQGWVYPTYYSSMSADEIEALQTAARKGRRRGRVWRHLTGDTGHFEPDRIYRGKGALPDAAADTGPIVMPKLFRRQVAYHMEKGADVFGGSFRDFLEARREGCFLTQDFLEQGANAADLKLFHEFLEGDRFTLGPEDLVFREKPSALFDANGRRITSF